MKWAKNLYVQVLTAIVAGVLLGWLHPAAGASLKPLADFFIKAVKMLIGPIIFCTVVSGIAGMGDLKKIGRVGWKALLYFEVATTIALVIGMVVANIFQPGAGIHPAQTATDAAGTAVYAKKAEALSTVDFLQNIIPDTFVGAFTGGDLLQVLFIAILSGLAMARMGAKAQPVMDLLGQISKVFFGIVHIVTRAAPIAAFGAMAFTIGKYGFGSMVSLGKLMACVYLTCAVFIFGLLGLVARLHGFSLWKVLRYIKEELLIVVGTSSSEPALPGLMEKMERAGCGKPVVGIVLPAGYSFNLDGTCIYLTLAALFIAQATGTVLSMEQQLGVLAILLLTSKGAAGVTGAGFVTLAATLSATHAIPVEGLALVIGVDRFMSEARAVTNLIGNTVGMLVVAKWEGEFNPVMGRMLLHRPPPMLSAVIVPESAGS
ncbi:MAG: dicarboxylate/amino acid:cation symporter [Verrucomicrobiota bacterium]